MKPLYFYLWIILLIFLDTLSKFWAVNILGENTIWIISPYFSLEYIRNPGIAFSIPITGLVLKILTLILIFGIIWYYITQEKSKKNLAIDSAFMLIIAGALWNAWERIYIGSVTDFFSLKWFAIWNLADSFLCIGILLLMYISYRVPPTSSNS